MAVHDSVVQLACLLCSNSLWRSLSTGSDGLRWAQMGMSWAMNELRWAQLVNDWAMNVLRWAE